MSAFFTIALKTGTTDVNRATVESPTAEHQPDRPEILRQSGPNDVERVPSPATARFCDKGRQIATERRLALPGKLYPLMPAEKVAAPLRGVVGTYGALLVATDTKPQPLAFADPPQARRFAARLLPRRPAAVDARNIYPVGSMGRRVSPMSVPDEQYRVELLDPAGNEPTRRGQPCSMPGINTASGQ